MTKSFLRYLIIFVVFASFVLSACSQFDVSQISDEDIDRITNKVIVCNPPYIRHGADCCLDTTGTGICDRDEDRVVEEIDDEKEEKEDVGYEKPVVEYNKTNVTEELIEEVTPIDKTQIEETTNHFKQHIKEMKEFKELRGHSLSQTFLEVDIDNLYSEFVFFREQKRGLDNIEYYKVKINGSYMNIDTIELYEVSHFRWEEVDTEHQDALFVKCLKETNTIYYANEECCDYQNDMLGSIFSEHKDVFYVNCADEMDECTKAEVKGLPTWIIGGNEKIGSYPKNQIAEFMECVDVVSREIDIQKD